MDMIKISQVLKLLLIIAALLIITPILSTSVRTTYLYFIVHLLIISLGAEAGLISFFFKSPYDKKLPSTNSIVTQKQHNMTIPVIAFLPSLGTSEHQETAPKAKYDHVASLESSLLITTKTNTGKVVEKCASEKIIGVAEVHEQALVKKCPSMPSLFFIGGTGDEEIGEAEEIIKEEKYTEREEVGDQLISKQELFYKAETFIGNFYKQLKIQREDSWKRLHDFYDKAAF
ncbi:uncharacterized protein [Solanum tuberosum]|uniref:Uncharacterized protein n=1 Tax=Solanum tuberosum TaxID=4113 RepID=M1B543_SOLTU|nr:PREDICTED: uncharacterized protein LOC107061554 [Solanum tuberosum]